MQKCNAGFLVQSSAVLVILVHSVNMAKVSSQKQCCSNILLDSDLADHRVAGNRLGFYKQLGKYGARPAYK